MAEDSKNGIKVCQNQQSCSKNVKINRNSINTSKINHLASNNRESMNDIWSNKNWFNLQAQKLSSSHKYNLSKKAAQVVRKWAN